MATDLSGQVALVTGAGRGIGQAVALALAGAGARLALAARSDTELAETAERCRAAGAEALAVPTDIADPAAVARLVERTISAYGGLDIAVNSAGVYGPIGPTEEVDPDGWAQAVAVNLLGPFYLCRAVVPALRARGGGRIILLAGGGATAPLPNFSAYAASKAGLVRLAETLAEELKPDNIYVNAIAPGLVDTRLQDEVFAAGERAGPLLAKIQAAREAGTGAVPPSVAADLVLFLTSPAAGALTGKLISAPHDPWREWAGRDVDLNATPLYTLRRLDAFTITPLLGALDESS